MSSSPESRSRLDDVLEEIEEFLEDQQDVRDGADGQQLPNKAMSLLMDLQDARRNTAKRSEIPQPKEWCKSAEFGCECGRPDTDPCPLPHPRGGVVDGRNFYELCQQYRHARHDPVAEFDAIRNYIKTGRLPWPSYE
jgi:hypothetical protein